MGPVESSAPLHAAAGSTVGGNVRVVCRLRPMNDREKKAGTVPAATASTERREVAVVRVLGGGTRQVRSVFHFDEVLTSFSTQNEVFNATLDPLVDEVLSGYEATAFAYGQTGTGKTYTMEGNLDSDGGRGLVPRTAAAVIERLAGGGYLDYSVSCSYLEIYNEELSDLLAPPAHQQRLDLKDIGGGRGVFCIGLSEVAVSSVTDILELVRRAQERRRVAETRVNARSSRSHCIFTLKVRCRRAVAQGELENTGRLHLVDLAGSECAKKAASEEAPAIPRAGQQGLSDEDRERKSINQSLLTLGRVISALREGSGRVPYRDSKLTRLLQDALGGRCKTVVIATISPALTAVEETISTLTYAEQASGIRNRPVASSLLRTIRLAAAGDVRGAVGCDVGGASGTVSSSDWAELEMKVAYLTQEVEEAQAALARKYREAQDLLERAASAEERLAEAETLLAEARQSVQEKAFVANRLAAFADDRCEAAAQLSRALDASTVYGDEMRCRLERARSATAASRRQARECVAVAEANGASLEAAVRAKAEAASAAAAEAYAAHHASACEAAKITEEHERLFAEILAAVAAGKAQLQALLAGVAAEAAQGREEAEASAAQALDAIEASMAQASDVVAQGSEEVGEEAARSGADGDRLATSLQDALAVGAAAAEAGAEAAARDLEAARAEAAKAHEAATARLRSTVQEPVAELQKLLEAAAASVEAHRGAVSAMQAQSSSHAAASAARWQRLLADLASAREAHASGAAAGQAVLHEALGQLGAALNARSQAAEAGLEEMGDHLSSVQASLTEGTHRGRAEVANAILEADGLLSASWAAEAALLQQQEATLAQASTDQRAFNVSEAVHRDAASTAEGLTEGLGAAVRSLFLVRDNIAAQVSALQEQRAAEQEIVDSLTKQREALEADAASLRATLRDVRAELAEGRGHLDELRKSQESGRDRLLEAVTAVIKSELASLSSGLSAGVASAASRLDRAVELAGQGEETVTSAEQRSADFVLQAASAAEAWSAGVAARCGAIEAAEERLREAAEDVESASSVAVEQLQAIEAATVEWGRGCCQVAELVDKASVYTSHLQAGLLQVQPEWQAVRAKVLGASEEWADDGQRAGEGIGAAAAKGAAARDELLRLRAEVSAEHASAAASLSRWESDSSAHAAVLGVLGGAGAGLAGEDAEAAAHRGAALDGVGAQASELVAGAARRCAEAGVLRGAVAAHMEALPAEFRARDAAFKGAAAAVSGLAARAAAAMRGGAAGAAEMQAGQSAALQSLRARCARAASGAAAALRTGEAAAAAQRGAGEAAAARAKACWERAQADQAAAVAATGAAADAAGKAAGDATSAGSGRVLAELAKGGRARDRAVASLEALAAESATALTEHAAALRRGLAAEPLAAFEEVCGSPPAARPPRPAVALVPRPSEAKLAHEFRGEAAVEEDVAEDRENVPACCSPLKLSDHDPMGSVRESYGSHGESGPRTPLGELNVAA